VTAFGLFPPQAGCTHPSLRPNLQTAKQKPVSYTSTIPFQRLPKISAFVQFY